MARTARALRGALLALLERKPLDQITVRDITAEAGISYATFFRHHPTKEALLNHVAADQIGRVVELTLPLFDPVDNRASLTALCTYIDEHRALWTALLTGGAAGTVREELLRVSREVAESRTTDDYLLPLDLRVRCSVGLIVEILTWWLRQEPGRYAVGEIAVILERVALLPGLGPEID